MKVYLVTEGSYSDYRPMCVCSTQETAEYAKRIYDSDNDIEEFELDALPAHPPGMLLWHVRMYRNGDVSDAAQVGADNTAPVFKVSGFPSPYKHQAVFSVWANDRDHAVKICGEKRAQLIAANQWHEAFDEEQRKWNEFYRQRI